MSKRMCPRCEINYIDDSDKELCTECLKDINGPIKGGSILGNNKLTVEKDLLPLLRSMSAEVIKSFTEKEISFRLLKLRLPLLVECKGHGKEACIKEIIIDKSKVYRYYVKPYDINGKMYHVCSQWSGTNGEESKDILNILKDIRTKQ